MPQIRDSSTYSPWRTVFFFGRLMVAEYMHCRWKVIFSSNTPDRSVFNELLQSVEQRKASYILAVVVDHLDSSSSSSSSSSPVKAFPNLFGPNPKILSTLCLGFGKIQRHWHKRQAAEIRRKNRSVLSFPHQLSGSQESVLWSKNGRRRFKRVRNDKKTTMVSSISFLFNHSHGHQPTTNIMSIDGEGREQEENNHADYYRVHIQINNKNQNNHE